jgi:hypothetical protein
MDLIATTLKDLLGQSLASNALETFLRSCDAVGAWHE